MNQSEYQIKQLADELPIPESGKKALSLTTTPKQK